MLSTADAPLVENNQVLKALSKQKVDGGTIKNLCDLLLKLAEHTNTLLSELQPLPKPIWASQTMPEMPSRLCTL